LPCNAITNELDAEDFSFSNKLQHEAEAAFAERKGKDNFVEYEFHEYKGLPDRNRISRLEVVLNNV
jgi:hypothetical protein